VRSFIGLLNLLDQNPGKTWQDLLGADVFQNPQVAMSVEEEFANGAAPANEEPDDDLTVFKV
jgi:hypothetical protein